MAAPADIDTKLNSTIEPVKAVLLQFNAYYDMFKIEDLSANQISLYSCLEQTNTAGVKNALSTFASNFESYISTTSSASQDILNYCSTVISVYYPPPPEPPAEVP